MIEEIYRGPDIDNYSYGEFEKDMKKIKALRIGSNDGFECNINPFQIWLKEGVAIRYINRSDITTISLIIDEENQKEAEREMGKIERLILEKAKKNLKI